VVYCRTVHCFLKIWFNKRTHPNERRNGQSRHAVNHDVYGDTTKWATDQSAIRKWPCKYSMHQYSILLQILRNWLITTHNCKPEISLNENVDKQNENPGKTSRWPLHTLAIISDSESYVICLLPNFTHSVLHIFCLPTTPGQPV